MALLIIFCAKYLFVVSIVLFLYAFWKVGKPKWKDFSLLSVIAFPMALVVGKILNHDIQDPRPFVVKHITPLVAHAADNGFPSDHTLLTMTIASIVFVYNKKLGIILGAISLCVGLARVFAQIHHLEDIIGSIIIAIGSTYVAYIVLPHILKKTGKQE